MRKRVIEIAKGSQYCKEADRYLDHLRKLGHGDQGARTKYNHLHEFLRWAELKGIEKIEELSPEQVTRHYSYLQQRPNTRTGEPLSLKSLHHHIQALKHYFKMLQAEGRILIDPMSALKFPTPKRDEGEKREILSQEEVKELYQHTVNHQEKAILSIAYGCGLRVSELVAMDIADIKLREGILIVRKGKGSKRRVVPMSGRVIEDLSEYYDNEREALTQGRDYKKGQQAFMLNSRGGRMQKYTYNKRLRAMILRTGNEEIERRKITIHNLRHSIATHLIERGVSVEQVREFLGHSQLESTEVYTRISRKQIKQMKR